MSKQIISTADAPAAIGVYSQAVRVGNTIWVSGQIPLDPKTKELVTGDTEAQVRQVFENLKAIVAAAGASFDEFQTEFFQKFRPTSLIKRFETPEEIASFVTYLASPLASAITGAALRVDGGVVKSAF